MKPLTITKFEQLIDPTKCRVDSFPGLVAIFGGTISEDALKIHSSKRNVFIQWLKKNSHPLVERLVIPENYKDWNGLGKYKDLLAFEKDLGYLTDAVVVFLEGPGSFAELGAFSQIESLASKLLVIIASEYHQDDSFISLGPIRSLNERFGKQALCIIPSDKTSELESDINLILERISEKQQRKNKTEAFQPTNEQHQVLSALDLIDLFIAVTREDLEHAMKHLLIPIDKTRTSQLLFLLDKAGLVKKKAYGDQVFYLPSNVGQYSLIDYSSSSKSEPFDRFRWRTEVLKEISNQGPRRRVCETHFGKEKFASWIS